MEETYVLIDECGKGIRWACPTEVVFDVGMRWVAWWHGGGSGKGDTGSERTV